MSFLVDFFTSYNPVVCNLVGGSVATHRTEKLKEQHRPTTPIISKVEVAPGCAIHVEESGNPQGIPAVFVHGGPGIKFRPTDHQWFDPDKYRIIVFQQRGTPDCIPSAMDLTTSSRVFQDVTIKTLTDDMESLRKHLNIDKWLVFGGSWGSTLSVFYAQEHPEQCLGIVVRGIFLATPKENALFLDRLRHERQCGAYWKPEALDRVVDYAKFKGFDVSLENTATIYAAYSELCVQRDDPIAQRIWTAFEEFVDDPRDLDSFKRLMRDDSEIDPSDRCTGIWETLLMNSVSLTYNLLAPERLAKLQSVPVKIVQGASDNLCHPAIAQELVDGLQNAGSKVNCSLVEGGAHTPYSPGMTDALIRATDSFASTGHF